MNIKIYAKIFFLSLCIFFVSDFAVRAQEQPGFVTEPVWISPKPEDGKSSTIFTTVYNSYSQVLVGVVEFFDDTTLLGSKPFSVDPKDVALVSLTWIPTPGDHSISVRMSKTGLQSKQQTTKITVPRSTLEAESFFVSKSTTTTAVSDALKNKNESSVSASSNKIGDQAQVLSIVDQAEDKIKDVLAPATTLSIQKIWDDITTYREPIYKKIEDKRVILRDTLSPTKSTETKEKVSTDRAKQSTPFAFISLFFVTLGAIIFSRTSIFVICCILGTIIVARSIWYLYKKLRGDHVNH